MIRVYPDTEALSEAAADLFVQEARASRERFTVALSGSRTPLPIYERLARPPHRDRIPWDRLHVFWGDERCLPKGDPERNETMARAALLDHVPLQDSQIHPIPCRENPESAAERYDAVLRHFFGAEVRFNLIFLGLGEDGHTASLFLGTPALEEKERWTAAVFPLGKAPRVTLTLPVINRAQLVVFLVTGSAKAEILQRVLEDHRCALPAARVATREGELIWLVDRAAAARLHDQEIAPV